MNDRMRVSQAVLTGIPVIHLPCETDGREKDTICGDLAVERQRQRICLRQTCKALKSSPSMSCRSLYGCVALASE